MASWCLFLVVNALVCSALSGLALGSPSSDVAVLQELLRKWKTSARPDVFENRRLDEAADPCNERRNGVACSSPEKSVIHFKVSSPRFISNDLKFLSHRALLQDAPVATPVAPPVPTPAIPPPAPAPAPVRVPVPAPAPVRAPPPVRVPAPAPVRAPAPPTPVRTYLMWVGIGAFCVVLTAVAVCALCRKSGQQKILEAPRLPPLPRYH